MTTQSRNNITQDILAHKLVAIIRLKEQGQVQDTVSYLVEGGVKVLEVTSNTPGFCEEIAKARKTHPDVLVGAGTVTNAALAEQAISAGAQFLVTPNTCEAVVKTAHDANIPVLMGALTPTEIADAIAFGADVVKLFPAGNLGIGYFKGISGPFNSTPFMAVGGINLDNTQEWLDAGAVGVGIGSDIAKPVNSPADREALVALAKAFVEKTK